MSEELKRKLNNYEENPPEILWSKIVAALDDDLMALGRRAGNGLRLRIGDEHLVPGKKDVGIGPQLTKLGVLRVIPDRLVRTETIRNRDRCEMFPLSDGVDRRHDGALTPNSN